MMSLIVEGEDGDITHFFGIEGYQADDESVTVFWPSSMDEEETSLDGKIVSGRGISSLDEYGLYDILYEEIIDKENDVVIGNSGDDTDLIIAWDMVVDEVNLNEVKFENVTVLN